MDTNSILIKCSYTKLEFIENLKEHPENNKIHPRDEDLNKRLSNIIKYQGWRHAIVVSKQSGYIIAGHARLEAAKLLGMKQVPIDEQDFENGDMEIAQLVADNALQEFRPVNKSAINEIVIPTLDGINFDIEMLGLKDFVVDVTELPEFKEEKKESVHECPNCGFEYRK